MQTPPHEQARTSFTFWRSNEKFGCSERVRFGPVRIANREYMLKYVGAILGVVVFLVCLVFYAARPSGALRFNVNNSFTTNGGYIVAGTLKNLGRSPVLLRSTNDAAEITMHVQIATNSFQGGGPLVGPFSKALLPSDELTYQVFVPTNAAAILMTEYSGKGNTIRRKLRSLLVTVYTLGKSSDTGYEVATTYVTPPGETR